MTRGDSMIPSLTPMMLTRTISLCLLLPAALLRGAHHVLNLLIPYLEQGQRAHLQALVSAYSTPANSPATLVK